MTERIKTGDHVNPLSVAVPAKKSTEEKKRKRTTRKSRRKKKKGEKVREGAGEHLIDRRA
jgi:hypothetical protein